MRRSVDGGQSGRVPQRFYARDNPRLPKELPILGLGCSSFSTFFASGDKAPLTVDTMSRDHAAVRGWIATIRHAVLDRGINLLDTAPWYGHGTSEVTIGYALDTILSNDDGGDNGNMQSTHPIHTRTRSGSLPRSQIIVNTKVGRYEADPLQQFDFTYDTTVMSVQRSLERMNCSYIDVIQLHDPEFAPSPSVLIEEAVPALLECRKRGWAKAIGLTGYPLEVQHKILVECQGLSHGEVVFDQSLVYCHNNLHDVSLFCDACFPSTEDAAEEGTEAEHNGKNVPYAEFCRQSSVRVMAAAPLSMGLLTNSGPPDWHPAKPTLKEACAEAAKLCQSKEVNISSLAVLFSLSQREVGCTLLGMKDVAEVDTAADLAVRFCGVDFDVDQGNEATDNQLHCSTANLDRVLSPAEKEVLSLLLDQSCGPFAGVASNGEYRWDGKEEAKKFWALLMRCERDQQSEH
ncbi:hypothetical protein ACHAXT_004288 [Thalassiosira profunda]